MRYEPACGEEMGVNVENSRDKTDYTTRKSGEPGIGSVMISNPSSSGMDDPAMMMALRPLSDQSIRFGRSSRGSITALDPSRLWIHHGSGSITAMDP
jgi:hypothetical protein